MIVDQGSKNWPPKPSNSSNSGGRPKKKIVVEDIRSQFALGFLRRSASDGL